MDTIDQRQQEEIVELQKQDIVHSSLLRTVQLLLGVISLFVFTIGAIVIALIFKFSHP